MPDYEIVFTRSASKEIQSLSDSLVNRIFIKIEALATEPRPNGCTKLSGYDNFWRIRIGDYRVIYSIESKEKLIDIIAVRHRKDAYK